MNSPFFAMDNGIQDSVYDTPQKQAALIKDLGYDGISYRLSPDLPEMLRALDAAGLRMFALFITPTIDTDGFRFDPRLEEALDLLAGRNVLLWPTINSSSFPLSDPAGDRVAAQLVRALADMAHARGLRVALYPHFNWWLQRLDDALRIAERVDDPAVGVTFTLCHWLMVEKDSGSGISDALKRALSRLFAVTINGSEPSGDSYATMIQTLDRGTFEVQPVIKVLQDVGYGGPVGLLGYGLEGSVHDSLSRSMTAWQKMTGSIPR